MHMRDSNLDAIVIKVPQVTLAFWIIKILATTLGETGGDAVTMSWLGETTPEAQGHRLSYRHGNLRRHFYRCGLGADQGQKISPVPLLADDCRNDDRRHDAGRLLHEIARHRLHRRFNHLAHLCDCVASDLALVDREHIDRNGEYTEGRNFLLGDNHVLPDLGDGAWRLGGRHK